MFGKQVYSDYPMISDGYKMFVFHERRAPCDGVGFLAPDYCKCLIMWGLMQASGQIWSDLCGDYMIRRLTLCRTDMNQALRLTLPLLIFEWTEYFACNMT